MNKVYGNFFYPKQAFLSKVTTRNLFFLRRMGSFFSCQAQGKKAFLSQSVQSTFVKLFVHVLLVV